MTIGRKPNILWVFSDHHRAQALGCYGDENVHTPLCAPCRATLYTGKYATSHGVISLHIPLPEVLRTYDYHTSQMGKWQLSGERRLARSFRRTSGPAGTTGAAGKTRTGRGKRSIRRAIRRFR